MCPCGFWGGLQSGVQLQSPSEVINRWWTWLLGRRRWTPPLQRPARLPARLINGAHVRNTREMTKKRLKVVSGPAFWAPGPGPASDTRAFLGQGPLFTDQATGCRAGIWLRFSHSRRQAGEDGCVCPDSPLQRTHSHQSHPLPHHPPPTAPAAYLL